MSSERFPDPVHPGQEVDRRRRHRRARLMGATRRGVIFRGVVVAAELLGFLAFDSSALLLDALSSLMDIGSTLFLMLCIRAAARPPDHNHPFGHGRYEPLGGLQLGLLLALVGAGLFIQQGHSLVAGHHITSSMDPRAWMISLVCAIVLEVAFRTTRKAARREKSPALETEAWHYRIDALSSALATLALGAGVFAPEWSVSFDHMGAMAIATMMAVVGIRAVQENMHQIMDRTPEEPVFARVCNAAMRVPGVLETEKIRIQRYGPDAHVDIDVEVDPKLSVDKAHRISQQVRAEIQRDWPQVRDVTVHIEPFYPDDH